jgi:hypothetical protein
MVWHYCLTIYQGFTPTLACATAQHGPDLPPASVAEGGRAAFARGAQRLVQVLGIPEWMDACECITPFCRPVVQLVYMICTSASPSTSVPGWVH